MEDQTFFSFDDIEVPAAPIAPLWAGTPNIFMTKIAYETPADKHPRLAITLERRAPGQKPEVSVIYIADYTIAGTYYSDPKEQAQDEMKRIFNILEVYRPDLDDKGLKAAVGRVSSWRALNEKVISLLPPNFDTIETTWFLTFKKGSDILKIGNKYPSVKLGNNQTFRMNSTYDLMVPPVTAPRQSATPTEFAPQSLPDEALFS